MKWFSLFSGIGGFDLSLQRLGHEIVGACEIDKYARQIYGRHFPDTKVYEDATKINPREIPNFDGICAGFPCQAFSVAGKRLGFEDTRGTLCFEIFRIVKEKRPSYLLLENVKGLLNHDGGKTFETILTALDEMGYWYEWQVFNSKYFVPQNRERIFIIGHSRERPSRKIFPLGEVCRESDEIIAEQEEQRVNCIDANYWKGIDRHGQRTAVVSELTQVGNIDTKGHNSIWGRVYDPKGISPTINAEGGGLGAKTGLIAWSKSGRDWGVEARVKIGEANTLNTGDGCGNQSTQNFALEIPKKKVRIGLPKVEDIQPYLRIWLKKSNVSITEIEKMFGNRAPHHWFEKIKFASLPDVDDWIKLKDILKFDDTYDKVMTEHRLMTEWEMMQEHKQRHFDKGNGFGVIVKDKLDLADTLTTWTEKTQVISDKMRIRKLTPLECERLQGFPDNWTEGISDTQRYKCIGNAVTVPVVTYIAQHLNIPGRIE